MSNEKKELTRQEAIHDKGFSMGGRELEFGSLKIGKKTLEDVILNLDSLKARA